MESHTKTINFYSPKYHFYNPHANIRGPWTEFNDSQKIPTDPGNIPQVSQKTNMIQDFLHKQVVADLFGTHRIHGTGIFTYVYHKNQPFMWVNIQSSHGSVVGYVPGFTPQKTNMTMENLPFEDVFHH